VPPGHTGQGMVEVTVTVVVGHVGQWVVTVGYGHVVGELGGGEGYIDCGVGPRLPGFAVPVGVTLDKPGVPPEEG
jgi:hypothetical protein